MVAACLAWPIVAGAATYAGRPVQDALRELGANGVNFIYNTDLVPPSLRVEAEPAAGTPVDIARQILAAYGLALLPVGENAFAVVKDKSSGREAGGVVSGNVQDNGTRAELSEIVVTTSRYALAYNQPQTSTLMTQADVQTLPKLADETLRSIQRLPGSAASGISAQSHIRGGEFDEVLMVLDGLPLNEPFHLKNFLTPVSVFDVEAIDSMDVYSGGFTADYGDRMSGVIDITPLSPPKERYTELGLSLFHANALSAGKFAGDRGQWLAAGRRSNLDLIAHAVNSEVGEPEYFDAFGRVSFTPTDTTTLFGSALTSHDDIQANTSDESEQTDAQYRNTYLWGGWQQEWPGNLSSRLILAFTDIDNDRTGSIDDPGAQLGSVNDHRRLRTGVARLDLQHKAERFYTRFGVEGRQLKAEYQYASTSTFEPDFPIPGDPGSTVTRNLAPAPEGYQLAAYVTSRARITDRLSAELGLRWDDQTYDDDAGGPTQFAPRVNVMYELAPATRLRAAWGRFWQSQGINELQVEDGVDTFYPAQRADQLIVSLEQALPGDVDLRVEAYQKDYDDVRPHFENLFNPVKFMPELEPDRVEVAPAGSRARGLELTLSGRADGPLSWWLNYAWSRVTDRIAGADVVRSWDQRHTVNAGLRYAGEHWEFTVTDVYHTGWPTTALFLTEDPGGGPAVVTVGARNAVRFGDYNSLDFRVMRRIDLQNSTLETFFEMTNALAHRNACCTDYEVSGSASEPIIGADQKYWPRLIPSIGVLWKF